MTGNVGHLQPFKLECNSAVRSCIYAGPFSLLPKKSLKIASGNPEMRHRTQACTKTAFKVEIDQSASGKRAGYFSDCDNRASVEHN